MKYSENRLVKRYKEYVHPLTGSDLIAVAVTVIILYMILFSF